MTSGTVNPLSKNPEIASWRRSWNLTWRSPAFALSLSQPSRQALADSGKILSSARGCNWMSWMAAAGRGTRRCSPFFVSFKWAKPLSSVTSFHWSASISPRRNPVSSANRITALSRSCLEVSIALNSLERSSSVSRVVRGRLSFGFVIWSTGFTIGASSHSAFA